MNIILVSGHSTLESGGVGTHLKLLIDQIKKDKEVKCNIVLGTGLTGRLHKLILQKTNLSSSKGLSELLTFFSHIYFLKKRIEFFLKKVPLDESTIIHAHDRNSVIAAALLRSKYKFKIIQTLHAPFYQQYLIRKDTPKDSLLNHLIKDIDSISLSFIDNYIAVDNLQKELLLRDFNSKIHSSDDIFVIPNAVEKNIYIEDPIKIKDKKFGVVVRHLHEKNGVSYAIKAMKGINVDNVILYIIGSGPEEHNLKELTKSLHLEKKVFFKGRLTREESLKYIAGASFSLVPSIPVGDYIEATSLTMLETMVLGTPLIASNIGGLKQVLDGNNAAFLVKPNDSNAISESITKILLSPDKVSEKTKNALNIIEQNYNTEKWYKEHKNIFKKIID